MNSIRVIRPYKWEGLWVFDDPDVGLVREPFVCGADTILDLATAHIPQADQGVLVYFAAISFPGAMALYWVRAEESGNVYRWEGTGMEGCLCPALLKYFPVPPERLFFQVRPII